MSEAHANIVTSEAPLAPSNQPNLGLETTDVSQLSPENATRSEEANKQIPVPGSRFIESGIIEGYTHPQVQETAEATEVVDLISLLHNQPAPPLAPSEVISIEPDPLPSVLFVIPFPAPVNATRSKESPPFLLYCPPRSTYSKPAKKENGKKGDEKLVKKITRKWQEEVVMGEEIKRGNIPNPTRFVKVRGACIRVASTISKWLPSSCIETLSRLPKREKLGKITIIHPLFSQSELEEVPEGVDRPYVPTDDELRNDFGVLLRKSRKRVLVRAILSGLLLPITLGIDVFAPVFAFEINVTYFAFQIYGLRKAKAIVEGPKVKKQKKSRRSKRSKKNDSAEEARLLENSENTELAITEPKNSYQAEAFTLKAASPFAFDPVLNLLYRLCSEYDPISFPPLPDEVRDVTSTATDGDPETTSREAASPVNLDKPGGEVSREIIRLFRENLPEEVAKRHLLDEDRLSEDLARYLKKASIEYIDTLNGRSDRSGFVFSIKRWHKNCAKKSAIKKEKKKVIKAEKKLAKEKAKEEKLEFKARAKASARGETINPTPEIIEHVSGEIVAP
ncbi:hypothetical protein BY996DRAFT_4578952 [Phakopsora pachyrhizi]|uniref:Secreted protein n=1 Tax=Phakopsora pachyrhizi TaxID=170000 RepID=A0AAV0BS80_PHAPC|nr:hypothetical protein BY996DRAFT_4578952 [Phakopsora pachyrhizi]CAH7688941.1 hypothetical protein PPACK8108_LOCUS23985 [Phakopsora pachyrhizi]